VAAIPNILGDVQGVAESKLRAVGLVPQKNEDVTVTDRGRAGKVHNQSPAANQVAASGSTVRFALGRMIGGGGNP